MLACLELLPTTKLIYIRVPSFTLKSHFSGRRTGLQLHCSTGPVPFFPFWIKEVIRPFSPASQARNPIDDSNRPITLSG